MTAPPASIDYRGVRLIAHPLVPEGDVWGLPAQGIAYVHARTLTRLKALLWAQQRTQDVLQLCAVKAALAAIADARQDPDA